MKTGIVAVALAASVALVLAGCAKKPPAPRGPGATRPTTQLARPGSDAVYRAAQVALVADEFPGRNEQDHRRLVEQAFTAVSRALPLLEGPYPTNAFREQLRIIDGSRAQVATASANLALEPTIDSGLRAVYNALNDLAIRDFAGRQSIDQSLARLRTNLDELDAVRGPMHRLVVGQAFREIAHIVQDMAATMQQALSPATTRGM